MTNEESLQLQQQRWLEEFSKKIEVQHLWFNDKELTLDGYHFSHCRFDKCRLHISSVNFEMTRCFIDDQTVISWSGEIVNVLRLFHSRHNWIYENEPAFAPEKHEDGTITIHAQNS